MPQLNRQYYTWSELYTHCRIMPLVSRLYGEGAFSSNDVKTAEHFCSRLNELFPDEKPALLHGDLWGGNYLITTGGLAALFDPAVYYGHREMDIGMTKLFGGFNQQFYGAYNAACPLEKGWEKRLPFTQAYPLLVHAVLFGGHYVRSAVEMMKGL
ncbi:MAG: fructosamine kinase family protein [Chitinophagaceae bacterium]|nr:fructosamine kinase family protein [Chitinophagaceae bacterium]